MDKVKVGASYYRVSTTRQVVGDNYLRREDGSLEVQRSRVFKHIEYKSQSDWQYEIDYEFEDAGISGKDTNRSEFQKLCKLIKDKKIDFMIATEISRISRNTSDFLNFVTLCNENNVELIILKQEIDSTTAWGKLALTILASLAEFERETTAERLRVNGRERLINDGKINGANEILGLVRDTKRRGHFITCPNEVKRLEEVLNIYLGSSGKSKTLKEIHRRNLRDSNNKKFTHARLNLLLFNVEWRYAGKWFVKDDEGNIEQTVDLDHGPVISVSLRKTVLNRIEESRKGIHRKGKTRHLYLLSTLLVDEEGHKFHGETSKGRTQKYRYYRGAKSKLRLNADELEDFISKRVQDYFKKSAIFENMILKTVIKNKNRVPEVKAEIKNISRKISEIKTKSDRLVERLADFSTNMPEQAVKAVTDNLNELGVEKDYLIKKKDSLEENLKNHRDQLEMNDVKKVIEQYASKFSGLERGKQRNLLEQIFEKIVVIDSQTLKLCIKKAPKEGLFKAHLDIGSNKQLNGGA